MAIERLYRPLSAFSRQQLRTFTTTTPKCSSDLPAQGRDSQQEDAGAKDASKLANKAADAARQENRRTHASGIMDVLRNSTRSQSSSSQSYRRSNPAANILDMKQFRRREVPDASNPNTTTQSTATTRSNLTSTISQSSLKDTATTARARLALTAQIPRRWAVGMAYAPHDLSAVEAKKWAQAKRRPRTDVFEQLSLDPLRCYKNVALLSLFVGETGRIRGARETGLKPGNQRKLAKAIRRAVGLGLMPSVYRHPELMVERENGGGR